MPRRLRAVSPPSLCFAPQDFIDIPQLTRLQCERCIGGQEQFLWDLYVVEGHFGQIQFVLTSDQTFVHRTGILECVPLFSTELVITITYVHRGILRVFTLTPPAVKFAELGA